MNASISKKSIIAAAVSIIFALFTVVSGQTKVTESAAARVQTKTDSESKVTTKTPALTSEVYSTFGEVALKAEKETDRLFVPLPQTSYSASIPSDYATTGSAAVKQQGATGSKWQFGFAPYLYMTGLNGRVGARGTIIDIDLSFGDVVSDLDLGIMGTFEARKGKFVMLNDLMWMKLSEQRDTPGSLYSTVRADVDMVIWDPEAGVRIVDSEKGFLDVLGGFRLMSIENNLEFGTGLFPGFEAKERKTLAMPVGGVRGNVNLSEKLFISGKFDIGGWGSNFTTQFYAGGGYRLKPNIALVGGYRYLKTDYDDNTGFIFDTTMNGILIGAKFTF